MDFYNTIKELKN